MKRVLIGWLLVLIASFSAYADSIVRVQCEDEDAGTEVYLNGKFVGECPVDAPVKEGAVQLRARKIVNGDYEKLFEKKLRVVDGVSQRVELVMSAPQLTAEARQKKTEAEATAQLKAAEAGDIDAMKKMARRYDAGIGVKKDPSQAAMWRDMAESATAQGVLNAANSGDIEAMKNIAGRYDTGLGVVKNSSQAQAWREKAELTKYEKIALADAAKREAKSLSKQRRLDAVAPFKGVKRYFKEMSQYDTKQASSNFTFSPIGLPFSTLTDLCDLPSNLTDTVKIQKEAALHPSSWGKPDSMIAQASLQQKTRSAVNKKTLLIVAAK